MLIIFYLMLRLSASSAASLARRQLALRSLPTYSQSSLSTVILKQYSPITSSSVLSFSSAACLREPASSAQAEHSPKTKSLENQLSWNEFLRYRTYRRGFQIASMGVTGMIGLVAGWGYVSTVQIDPTQMIFGFDPLLVMGVGLFGFTGLSALAGPLVGNFVFNFIILRGKRIPFRLVCISFAILQPACLLVLFPANLVSKF